MFPFDPFDKDILTRQYIDYTPYKLRDWIDEDKLDIKGLSSNPNALNYIINKYGEKSIIKTSMFHMLPNSLLILEKKIEFVGHLQDNWTNLSMNPAAYNLIMNKIDYDELSSRPPSYKNQLKWCFIPFNPCMLPIIRKLRYTNKYNINDIGLNPNPLTMKVINNLSFNERLLSNVCANDYYDTMPYIYKNQDKLTKVCWKNLSGNKYAIKLLEKNLDKIDWSSLSKNSNAIHLIEQNLDKIDWKLLSINPNALHILENNQDKIYWNNFIKNTNPNTIKIIEKNMDKYDPIELSMHPNLIDLLENNKNIINWEGISMNKSIFVIDYDILNTRNKIFKDELIEYAWNPDRFQNWCLSQEEKEEIYNKFNKDS